MTLQPSAGTSAIRKAAVAAFAAQSESLLLDLDEAGRRAIGAGVDPLLVSFRLSRDHWAEELAVVQHWQQVLGGPCPRERRPRMIDEFLPKIEQWVYDTQGTIRADKAHEKLVAMGFTGSPRSSRRAVAGIKQRYRLGQARVHRPWVTEPGLWLQYDFGDGPVIDGRPTVLFCAWLAWSRYRIVIPLRDRTIPSVFAALDTSFRMLGGAPTYVLTDNEKSVTVDHVAGLRQVDVAEALDVPQSFVSKYETGERRLDLIELRQVCGALSITLTDLVRRFDSGGS